MESEWKILKVCIPRSNMNATFAKSTRNRHGILVKMEVVNYRNDTRVHVEK